MHKHVDAEAVARVQKICNATGAKVVVSSTWRKLNTLQQLKDILSSHGFTGEVIGTTPNLNAKRGSEISQWLNANKQVESFVIIDDDSDMVHLMDKLVQTSFDKGLQDEHVEMAIKVLAVKV